MASSKVVEPDAKKIYRLGKNVHLCSEFPGIVSKQIGVKPS